MKIDRETGNLPKTDWLLLGETTLWLFLTRLAIISLPFNLVIRNCGVPNTQSSKYLSPGQRDVVDQITWAIDAVRWVTPWDSNCLARAITGKRMLRRRGLSSTLYLGVNKSKPQTLEAHAWLRCGDRYITGVPENENFTTVATFAELPNP